MEYKSKKNKLPKKYWLNMNIQEQKEVLELINNKNKQIALKEI